MTLKNYTYPNLDSWRSTSQIKVDLIIANNLAIKIKSSGSSFFLDLFLVNVNILQGQIPQKTEVASQLKRLYQNSYEEPPG